MLINMGALGAIKTKDGWDFSDEPAVITVKLPPKEVATALPRAPAVGSGFLDKFLPVKIGSDGKATIFGLPPAVVYAVVALLVTGGGYYAFRRISSHRHLMRRLRNPSTKKKRNSRGRAKR